LPSKLTRASLANGNVIVVIELTVFGYSELLRKHLNDAFFYFVYKNDELTLITLITKYVAKRSIIHIDKWALFNYASRRLKKN